MELVKKNKKKISRLGIATGAKKIESPRDLFLRSTNWK